MAGFNPTVIGRRNNRLNESRSQALCWSRTDLKLHSLHHQSIKELIRQAYTAEQAVARITANQSGIGVSQSVGASTGGAAQADLRGLGAQSSSNKTLVLLNGRRLANSAFVGLEGGVDLNAIPLNSIDRIEVLRDGASALYGTDAKGAFITLSCDATKRDEIAAKVSGRGRWRQGASFQRP